MIAYVIYTIRSKLRGGGGFDLNQILNSKKF
jgi:hypothetical protein